MLPKAIAAGVKIACGTDAPAIPHGQNAKEIVALVDRGMTPIQALRAATVTSAELIEMDDELGRLAPGYLADIIAVPGDPSRGHHRDPGRAVRDEGRPHLQVGRDLSSSTRFHRVVDVPAEHVAVSVWTLRSVPVKSRTGRSSEVSMEDRNRWLPVAKVDFVNQVVGMSPDAIAPEFADESLRWLPRPRSMGVPYGEHRAG